MMLSSTIILLLVASIFAPPSVSVTNPQKHQSKAPSKRNLKDVLGEPVKCPSGFEEGVCFEKNNTWVIVQFNSSDIAESISIRDGCVGIYGLIELVNQIVPKAKRGKFLKRIEKPRPSNYDSKYKEEYKYLTMEYLQDDSRGCIPAQIELVWKR